jgi:urease accessory protein
MMDPLAFLRALQFSDSLFPTGAFAYSDGLETAVAAGHVRDAGDLESWMRHVAESVIVECDGPAALGAASAFAREDWETLAALDREVTALKPAAATRAGSSLTGRRLLKTWLALYPADRLDAFAAVVETRRLAANLPIAYAVVATAAGLEDGAMLLGYGYGRLAGVASAALRLMAIGQQQAQRVLSARLAELPPVVDRILAGPARAPRSFAPAQEIEQMRHRQVYSRLFRS